MKLSIMIAAATGLAAATPLRARQTESKRPFVHPSWVSNSDACGEPVTIIQPERHSEACVGTLNYCQKGYYAEFGERFGSAKECIDSREPETTLKPVVTQRTCDCSKPVSVDDIDFKCPDGYESTVPVLLPECVQIGCSYNKYEAQCGVKSQDPTSAAV